MDFDNNYTAGQLNVILNVKKILHSELKELRKLADVLPTKEKEMLNNTVNNIDSEIEFIKQRIVVIKLSEVLAQAID